MTPEQPNTTDAASRGESALQRPVRLGRWQLLPMAAKEGLLWKRRL